MSTHRLVAALLFAGVLLTACATASESSPVRPIDAVIDEEIGVTPAPDGRSAVLRVTTSLEMACAVVYGETQELGGGLATDIDMRGGAHKDHQATMTGLEPDTEYFYRVQGSGVDGALYQGELTTFRTPAAREAARENVAEGATVVEASSEFSGDFAAGNAVDGDLATEWSTAGDGDDAWITLDLGEPVDVTGIGFRSRAMGDGSGIIERYTVTVDGRTLGPFEAGEGLSVAETTFTGREIRFDAAETTGGNTGAVEIEVYSGPKDSQASTASGTRSARQ